MVMVRAEGIVLDKKDKSSESTPLELAVNETGNWDVVKVLAEAGADVTGTRSDIVRVFGEPAYQKLMTCDFDDTMLLGNANAALSPVQQRLREILDTAQATGIDNTA